MFTSPARRKRLAQTAMTSDRTGANLTLESLEVRCMLDGAMGPSFEPVEVHAIADPFAFHAVTYEQMVKRAATFAYRPGELVVAVPVAATADAAPRQVAEMNWSDLVGIPETQVLRTILTSERAPGTSVSLVQLDMGKTTDIMPVLARLATRADVLWAAPNFSQTGVDPREYEPNDPQFGSQWHHDTMKNWIAWDITEGSGIVIGITDDGFDLGHQDLSPNVYVNPGETSGNGIDDDGNGYVDDVNGWDFISGNNNPNPNDASNDHGTHVAGIAAARTDNNIGVSGTAGKSKFLPIQFYDLTLGWNAAEIAAAYTYGANQGAKIVSTSYNVDGWVGDPTFTAGLQYMYDHGVLHFNSAGNNAELDPLRQAFEQSILVASTDVGDLVSSYSNYGTGIDVAAPGGNILSTLPGNTYGNFSGTSMATPNAAAAAALVWAAHPGWTREQVAAQLLGWATNIDGLNPGYAGLVGSGRVNTRAAVLNNPLTLVAPKVLGVGGLPVGSVGLDTPITEVAVRYSQVMNGSSATNSANYELRQSGTDGIFGTGDDTLYPLSSANSYLVGTNWVRLNVTGGPLGVGSYRFRIVPGGVENAFGTDLDGDDNGSAGGIYEQFFTITLNDFQDVGIPGSLASTSAGNVGSLAAPGETDTYSLVAAAGEKLSLQVFPSSPGVTLQARIGNAGAWVAAPAPGAAVLVPLTLIATAGTVDLQVSGNGATTYSFDMIRNIDVHGLTEGGVVSLDAARLNLGSSSATALGAADGTTGGLTFDHYNNPGLFVDISGTGTALDLGDDGMATVVTSVGNALLPAGSIRIGNNGGVLGQLGDLGFSNTQLPNAGLGRALLPLWDDIDSDTGNVYWQETTVNGINTLIVQWNNRPHYSNVGNATFQLQLFASGPVTARYVYPDVDFGNATYDFGASATIGVQIAANEAYQFSLNSAVLSNGSVLDIGFGLPNADSDDYTIDWTGKVGKSVDVVLSGLDQSFAGQTLELLDPNNNVVATGVTGATNYDLGILDFVIATSGVHKVRLTSNITGDYALLATEDLVFDTESNNSIGTARSLNNVSGALGWIGNGSVSVDQYQNPALFVDISATGTPLNLNDDSSTTIITTVGNALFPAGQITVSNNGGIVESGFDLSPGNSDLPSLDFEAALLPLWDDIDGSAGNVYWQELSVDGVQTLVVQWHNRPHYPSIGSATFQLQLFATGPIAARFVYQDIVFDDPSVDNGADATIGVQQDSSNALLVSLDQPSVADGDVLDFVLSEQDIYAIDLATGDTLDVTTTTPFDLGSRPAANTLDPQVTLLDSLGNPLLADTNSAPDGKNAHLQFVAPAAGTYYLAVSKESGFGDYVLHRTVTAAAVKIAAGVINNADSTWRTINLSQTFNDPVVLVGPMGSNDQTPGVVRIRNVTGSSFEVRVDEWDYLDDIHPSETVSYLVLERGVNVLDNGAVLVADHLAVDGNFSQQSFGMTFAGTPLVLATVASQNGSETVTPRLKNVTSSGFEIRVQEQESLDGVHVNETINYLALLPGVGNSNGLTYEAKLKTDVSSRAFPQNLSQTFVAQPRFLATMQTTNNADTATVRLRSLTARRVSMIIDEEQSFDAERAHAIETVGFFAFRYVPPAVLTSSTASDSTAASNRAVNSSADQLGMIPTPAPLTTSPAQPVRSDSVQSLPLTVEAKISAELTPAAVTVVVATPTLSTAQTPSPIDAANDPTGWVRVANATTRSPGWYW